MRVGTLRSAGLLARWWLLSWLALVAPLAANAAAPDPVVVKELLQKLGSETRRERVEAEQRLLELGAELLETLPPADLIENVTARDAVGRIRQQLELDAARQSIRPRLATLQGTKTFREWVVNLREQTGNDVDVAADQAGRSFTLDVESAPFWKTLRSAGWAPRYEIATNRVSLQVGASERGRGIDDSGIFRVSAEAVRRKGQVHVMLELWGEPRIRPLYATIADGAVSLDRGELRSTAVSPDARREIPMTGRGPGNVTVPLEFPAARFAQLEGTLQVKTAAFPERVEFDRLAEGGPVARRRGGATVTFHRAAIETAEEPGTPPAKRRSVTVRLAIAYDHGGPEFESHRLWLYHNEAWLETRGDEKGAGSRRIAAAPEIDSLEEANGGLALDYRFPGVAEDLSELRFVYVVPSLILDVPVPFRIPDLTISEERDEAVPSAPAAGDSKRSTAP